MQMPTPNAALAGVPAGVQANGLWIGRRQLFVRFAAEAETATMYTPDALANELERLVRRSAYHSISICGRDPLSNAAFLKAALESAKPALPVMLDVDGQRPESVADLMSLVALLQVTLEGAPEEAAVERALSSLQAAAGADVPHALVLAPEESTTDGQLLRAISRAHSTSGAAAVVIHPPAESVERDRRWLTFMEQAVALHADTRLLLRLPRPSGTR
ncbi:MAG: hypothetical protein KGL38_00240 [Gemmatimonadota bacterium]|nr:hypothetical protein [Gemmatimonadota bacterium]MDE3172050.1 hypothetical protein [Gemmatimonadota bacterium]MDE3216861.1 hypothetical protein [Gemmatimonadota bacterium]